MGRAFPPPRGHLRPRPRRQSREAHSPSRHARFRRLPLQFLLVSDSHPQCARGVQFVRRKQYSWLLFSLRLPPLATMRPETPSMLILPHPGFFDFLSGESAFLLVPSPARHGLCLVRGLFWLFSASQISKDCPGSLSVSPLKMLGRVETICPFL